MVAHYVQAHDYRPPTDFVDAVLARPADRVPLSASSGTWLGAAHGQWVVGTRTAEHRPLKEAMIAALPLLEKDPESVLPVLGQLNDEPFPVTEQRIRQHLERWLNGERIQQSPATSRVVVQCNMLGTGGQAPRGYVAKPNFGNVAERIEIVVRHKRGAWAAFWVPITQVDNFRVKTIPVAHPRFHDRHILDYPDREAAQSVAEALQAAHDRA